MPLYVFECPNGHRHELFFKVAEKPDALNCHICGAEAKQVPAIGGIRCESPTWLNDDVRGALQDDDAIRKRLVKPIETRKELREAERRLGVVCVG